MLRLEQSPHSSMKKDNTALRPISWLVVGLGNPGERYAATRHNIGWMVCDAFVRQNGATFAPGQGAWFESFVRVGRENVAVILPMTYMNKSGEAAAEAQRLFRVLPERIIIVVDEYNFPVGKVHLKGQGRDGGHNGVSSMIESLGTENFWRLRCGIDRNFGPGELVEYVLAPFTPDEEPARDRMITDATVALKEVITLGPRRSMNIVNLRSSATTGSDGEQKKS